MSSGMSEGGGPPRPKPRPYSPPPGAAKPSEPPKAEPRKYQPPPGAAKPPTPNMPSGAAAAAAAKRPTVGLRGTEFEFSFEQDALLKELAGNLRTVSWLFLLAAAALFYRHARPLWEALQAQAWTAAAESAAAFLGGLALAWIFWSLRQAGGHFADIVDSQAQDVPLLMQALRSLNRAFGTVSLVIAGIALLGLVVTVLFATFALAK